MPPVTKKHFAAVALAALLLSACATTNINLPSVTESPTGQRMPGKIIWRDLLTNDPAASQHFYGELFGWQFESAGTASNLRSDEAYTLVRHNGRLIGGMIDTLALNGRDDISQWVVLMSVDDVRAATQKVEAAGGRVITPPTDLKNRGRLAVVRDAEGAMLGLLETLDGDPADRSPEAGDFLWDELWTTDLANASSFYADIAGLEAGGIDIDVPQAKVSAYRLLKAGDTPRVGIMPNPLDGLDPVWVSYLRVESPAAITSQVAELGGRVIVESGRRPLGGEVAFVAGPSGAGVALQTWPVEKQDLGTPNNAQHSQARKTVSNSPRVPVDERLR
jgi:predicted enzyme related to lactoylglutathione lyase